MNSKKSGEILVAIDGSAPSRAAAQMGIRLAASEGLVVRGLYVVDEALALDVYSEPERELDPSDEPLSRAGLIREFEVQGERALDWLTDHGQEAGVPVGTGILVGGVPELLAREADGARFLTIGRRGRGHAGRAGHLGSTFHTVVHTAELPTIVGGDEERPLRRVLVAYDGGSRAREGLSWAARLQDNLSVKLTVVSVQDTDPAEAEKWLQEAQDQLGRGRDVRLLTASGRPGDAIVSTAREQQSDLIIMGRYRHGALLESIVGSPVGRVLRESEVAVFMV
ncbi:MAG: universal stress protein [Anaerolineae bacterium]|jgi:nucleotide-binding universal stress UspA family protein